MKIATKNALLKLAQQASPFLTVFEHGTLQVEIYKPAKVDLQKPHTHDEVYIVVSGRGEFLNDRVRVDFSAGDFLFVPSGVEHRFENFTDDFST